MQYATKKCTALFLTSLALLSPVILMLPAHAENMIQTVELVKVDVQKLSTGYRASKLIGTHVVNDANETIGKIDDLIINPDDKLAYAIISVGGWLGMGSYRIAIPYSDLRITPSKITLPGATKEGVKNLPEFKYSNS